MEEDGDPVLMAGEDRSDGDLLEHIHRKLAGLDMPCTCKEQLDRTIVAIEAWQKLKTRRDLIRTIEMDYRHLVSGVSFLSELADLGHQELTAQDMYDHAESLKFLADLADRCARSLTGLARVTAPE